MKKLFTLVALLSMFLGANAAEWKQDYKIDYSTYKGFPFYVMGYVPEWVGGVMTDYGSMYKYVKVADDAEETSDVIVETNDGTQYYKISLAEAGWHQYFIADGINTGDMADVYTVKALVKASKDCTINVNMGWGWGEGQAVGTSVTIPQSDDFVEVEWEYTGIGGASCNLVAQPGTFDGTIEWKSLEVGHSEKVSRPTTWQEWLTSDGQPVVVETTSAAIPTYMGNAETPWGELANVKFNDQEKNMLVCAWGKEKGVNMNENDGWDPFPATIEEVDGSHVFVVHGKLADSKDAEGGDGPSAWDNQFWIQSPQSWKEGSQIKVHFRYKASQPAKTNTQIHKQNPSDYLIWHAIGDINFTTEWQEFDGTMTMASDMAGGWSIAFNLNAEVKEPTDFYFDDLSWQTMVLEEGYFVAGINTSVGSSWDFDQAVKFEEDEEGILVATIGEDNAYVDQIMISTVMGNDAAFKSNTLKPAGTITNDPDEWLDYAASGNAKLSLPALGIWKIYIDPEYKSMAFELIKGEAVVLQDVVTNAEEIVVNALERDDIKDDDHPDATGAAWDNQFWIIANRTLATGEETVVKFKYKAKAAAKASTQCHVEPGAYKFWGAIGDVNFTEEWQDFETTFTVPADADGMQSIAFNLAEIKEANDYYFKDFQWYLASDQEGKTRENLINETGKANFAWKVNDGAGIITGIKEVATKKNVSTATYNLAGQRVSDSFKGIVIKDGKKFVK